MTKLPDPRKAKKGRRSSAPTIGAQRSPLFGKLAARIDAAIGDAAPERRLERPARSNKRLRIARETPRTDRNRSPHLKDVLEISALHNKGNVVSCNCYESFL